jgi:hypothetical protein
MAAKSSKGITVCMTAATPAVATPIVPTAIVAYAATGTSPAGVTVDVPTQPAVGEVVSFADTGFASLDGKSFVVTALDSTTGFKVGGVVLGNGTLGVSPKVVHYVEANDITCLCLSSLSISEDAPGTISVATFCDPSASLPATSTSAGSIAFAGFVDVASKDYPALLAAVADGKPRVIRITLPSNGYIVAPLIFSSMTYDLPLDGAVGFSGTAALSSKPMHLWA